jgi:hypothetical protein
MMIIIDDPVKVKKEKKEQYKEPFVYLRNTKKSREAGDLNDIIQ